jgi:hypothetical protein
MAVPGVVGASGRTGLEMDDNEQRALHEHCITEHWLANLFLFLDRVGT